MFMLKNPREGRGTRRTRAGGGGATLCSRPKQEMLVSLQKGTKSRRKESERGRRKNQHFKSKHVKPDSDMNKEPAP